MIKTRLYYVDVICTFSVNLSNVIFRKITIVINVMTKNFKSKIQEKRYLITIKIILHVLEDVLSYSNEIKYAIIIIQNNVIPEC